MGVSEVRDEVALSYLTRARVKMRPFETVLMEARLSSGGAEYL